MANAGWRLTEDEVIAEASKDSTYCQLSVDVGMWASKAQTKKIIERLEEEIDNAPVGSRLATVEKCLQALRQEVLGE